MHDRSTWPDNERSEQLNVAIDRMLSGEPVPPLADADLNDLLHLAERLFHELPRDMPDPAFRLRLKDELTGPYPVLEPGAQARGGWITRFPYVAIGAIAAVLIAAVAVGSFAIWGGGGSSSPQQGQLIDTLRTATVPVTASTLVMATETSSQITALRTQQPTQRPQATDTPASTPHSTAQPTQRPTEAAPTVTASATTPAPTTTSPAEPTAQVTAPSSLALLPAVDPRTIEQGAVPAAEGGGAGPNDGVTFEMDAPGATLAAAADAYHFSPPDIDPDTFCHQVADQLAIGSALTSSAASGQLEYFAGDPGSGTFHWVPDTGVFQFSAATAPGSGSVDEAGALDAARSWLIEVGYPVEYLDSTGTVQPLGEQWQVETNLATVPTPGIGRAIGTWVLVNADGSVAEANGFWLTPGTIEEVSLIPWDAAWTHIQQGDGYWLDGGMSADGGTFTVEQVELSYALTRTDSDLVLQPVVMASGSFVDASGSSERRIAVFIQAARTSNSTP